MQAEVLMLLIANETEEVDTDNISNLLGGKKVSSVITWDSVHVFKVDGGNEGDIQILEDAGLITKRYEK